MTEIGSEFPCGSNRTGPNRIFINCFPAWESRFVLSGRTGLELIVHEIRTEQKLRSILLPAYCCSSMTAPFSDNGVQAFFYSAENPQQMIEKLQRVDAVLVMDYFGFIREDAAKIAHMASEMGKIIIADATQTMFSKSNLYAMADYIVMSCRKWSDLLCAVVLSKNGFRTAPYSVRNVEYAQLWREAAEQKKAYLMGEFTEKDSFLSLYGQANHMLWESYSDYAASHTEVDRLMELDDGSLRFRRRENAEYLLKQLAALEAEGKIQLMFHHLHENDCPLFIPILVAPQQRSRIRSYMTAHKIYCPMHWPITEGYPSCETVLHRTELSLICDQRYDLKDMEREIEILRKAVNGEI